MRRLVVAVVIAGASACAQRAAGPADTIAAFAAAVERKDYAAAYQLMSPEYQKRVSLVAFRAELEAAAKDNDMQAAARRLRDNAGRAPVRLEVEIDLGEKLPLVLDGGRWRIDGQPFEIYSQRSPRAALRTFLRALEQRRYHIVLRLVPSRYRTGVTVENLRDYWEGARKADNAKLLQTLKANIGAPIVELGDEAHMPYGDHEVRFLREDGLWRIEDPD